MTSTANNNDLLKKLGTLAFATRLKRLSDLLMNDVAKLYKEHHVNFEPRWFALLYLLHEEDEVTIGKAAQSLGFSHPAIIQLVEQMQQNKLIKTVQSSEDARRRIISLADKGRKTFVSIQPLLNAIQKATEELLNNSDASFLKRLGKLEQAYHEKNIYERVKSLTAKSHNGVQILTYDKQYAKDFKRLNLEWIKKYFKVETTDLLILDNVEKEILNKDGEIFFAKYDSKIVGTVAMIKHDTTCYELAKMGVTEKYRGLKISHHLIEAAINFAKEKKAGSIILDTNSSLVPAITLYKKHGFKDYKKKEKEVYERSDVHLKLKIKT
ncbi:MAG: bifunctional helix-turn-helix transcriptional regulator/GNAT family N-acetyltransferase [Bacteroidia bacterium]